MPAETQGASWNIMCWPETVWLSQAQQPNTIWLHSRSKKDYISAKQFLVFFGISSTLIRPGQPHVNVYIRAANFASLTSELL